MKFNNKVLVLVFVGLLALYFGQKMLNKPTVRSFKEVLVNIDTSSVTKINFYPKGGTAKITLEKNGSTWTADNGSKKVDATVSSVFGLLGPAENIKTLQLVSKSEAKWKDYEVDDTSGKKIEFYNGDKLLSAFYVGRFSFNQNTRSAKTYMRLANESDIYIVDGFLSMSYDKQFNDFRNKQIVSGLSPEDVTSIELQGHNQNVTISKDLNNQWINSGNDVLDSTVVSNLVQQLANLRGIEILDAFSKDINTELAQLLIKTNNNQDQTVDIYKINDSEFAISGSTNPNVYFKSDSAGVFKSAYLDIIGL